MSLFGKSKVFLTGILECDFPITDFDNYSMECELGGHKKPKLKRLQRHEKEGENLENLKPILPHSPLALISLKEACLQEQY